MSLSCIHKRSDFFLSMFGNGTYYNLNFNLSIKCLFGSQILNISSCNTTNICMLNWSFRKVWHELTVLNPKFFTHSDRLIDCWCLIQFQHYWLCLDCQLLMVVESYIPRENHWRLAGIVAIQVNKDWSHTQLQCVECKLTFSLLI